MGTPLRVLLVEDSEDDVRLLLRHLKEGGFDVVYERVETAEGMQAALQERTWEIVLSDYSLPGFNGREALKILKATGLDIPFILVSGAIGEETAAAAMRSGAHDYIMKNNLARLVPSIKRELREGRVRAEKKKAEADLKEAAANWLATFDAIEDAICLLNEKGIILQCNDAYELLTGRSREKIVGRNCRWIALSEELLGDEAPYKKMLASRTLEEAEVFLEEKWLQLSLHPILDGAGHLRGAVHIIRDITRRKKSEEAILRSQALLHNVIDSTPDWIYVKDRRHCYMLANKSFAGALGLTPKDLVGKCDTEFWSKELCFGDPEKGIPGYHDRDREALQGVFVHIPDEIAETPDGVRRVFDTYKIPLAGEFGYTYGVLCYSRDITQTKKWEDELVRNRDRLEHNLDSIVALMGALIEQRDPYTAGHQSRVAALVGALAGEMGLKPEQVEGLRIGALLHDIGKITISTDILVKPGKLSEIEFSLIKQHPAAGYDIVKKIDFPPEIAEMILQHHERLDGSGYPRGLSGQAIILEARILGVGDVVEAMSSHRPYRPALGLEAALQQVIAGKGILFDPEVVEACVRLVRDKGFKFD